MFLPSSFEQRLNMRMEFLIKNGSWNMRTELPFLYFNQVIKNVWGPCYLLNDWYTIDHEDGTLGCLKQLSKNGWRSCSLEIYHENQTLFIILAVILQGNVFKPIHEQVLVYSKLVNGVNCL